MTPLICPILWLSLAKFGAYVGQKQITEFVLSWNVKKTKRRGSGGYWEVFWKRWALGGEVCCIEKDRSKREG